MLGAVGHLALAGEDARVPGGIEDAGDEPLDGLGLTSRERRLAGGEVGVVFRGLGAFLGDPSVVLGLGGSEGLPPLRFLISMFGLRRIEAASGCRELAPVPGSRAKEEA